MLKSKFCGQCGFENPLANNFCHNCGSNLIINLEIEDQEIISNEIIEDKYLDLKSKIITLIDLSGYLVVHQDDNFIRFYKQKNGYTIHLDLGDPKDFHNEQLSELEKRGFDINKDPISKKIVLTHRDEAINDIIQVSKYIFDTIFINENSYQFIYEEHFSKKEDTPSVNARSIKKEKSKTTNKENKKDDFSAGSCTGKIGAIIIVSLIIATMIGKCGNNTGTSPSTNTVREDPKEYGRLVGVWHDEYSSKFTDIEMGYKIVLDKNGNLLVGVCDINQEDLQVGAVSEIKLLMNEIKFDGKMYVDQDNFEEKYLIRNDGSLQIFDNYGLIDTYPVVFFDSSIGLKD